MLRDAIRILFAERLQLSTGHAIEIFGLNVVRDERVIMTRSHRLNTERITVFDLVRGTTLITRSRTPFPRIP